MMTEVVPTRKTFDLDMHNLAAFSWKSAIGTEDRLGFAETRQQFGHGGRSPTRGMTEPIGWRHAGGRCRAATVEEAKGTPSFLRGGFHGPLDAAIHHSLSVYIYICTYKTLTILLQGGRGQSG